MEKVDLELIKSVIKTKQDLENARLKHPDGWLDKLSYLIKEAKEKGYELDMLNELRIKIQERQAI